MVWLSALGFRQSGTLGVLGQDKSHLFFDKLDSVPKRQKWKCIFLENLQLTLRSKLNFF